MLFLILFLFLVFNALLNLYKGYWQSDESDEDSIELSTPEECARNCSEYEEPKNCYYTFQVEYYTTVGPACNYTGFENQCIVADGFEKTILPINRQLPGPLIEICLNDRVIIDVTNGAPGMEITMHWHGIFQNGYQYYDGVPYITQCPIGSSTTFRYDFVVANSGTHFYHSHVATHMLDGQVGALIVRDPPSLDPHSKLFDTDQVVIFLTDWMHELSIERFPGWYRHDIGQTAKNILINGLGNWTDPDTKQTTNGSLTQFTIEQGLRHRMRMINSFSTVCLAELSIEKHRLTIIAQDGANVQPKTVDKIVSATGERVDFILTADQDLDSYWIQVRGLGECAEKGVQQLAILRYENGPAQPSSAPPAYNDTINGVTYNDLDATKCNTNDTETVVCSNQLESVNSEVEIMKVEPDARHILPFWFFNYTQYDNKPLFGVDSYRTFMDVNDYSQLISTFNKIAFETPQAPLISQANVVKTICKPNQMSNCTEPCICTQVINVSLHDVVELIIYDAAWLSELHHPFHLHGYEFKIFSIGQYTDGRNISTADIDEVIEKHTERLKNGEYHNPPGKDTVKIPTNGYSIIRFKADNPGWWLIHCHFSWHHLTGMELVIRVGTKADLPSIPDKFPQCSNWKPALHTLNEF
ncbi:Laccase-4, partial [Eufriesea mexicana]